MTPSIRPGHGILREHIDYDVDQPLGWIVKCKCGETFTHCAPEGARRDHAEHAAPSIRPGNRGETT